MFLFEVCQNQLGYKPSLKWPQISYLGNLNEIRSKVDLALTSLTAPKKLARKF